MRCLFLALLGLAATSSCTTTLPGHRHAAFWRTNGYDRQGEQHGRWRTYFDETNKQTRFTTGRYRHGRPVGHWRYYNQLGTLDHEERYHRTYSDITFYHPNGQVSQKGRARVADEGTVLHYFWFGEWKRYSETGRLVEVDTYEKGRQIASHPIQDM